VFTQAEIADRMEIQHRVNLYCHALDNHEWDQLDEVFMPDAVLDFSCLGLAPHTWLQMKERLRIERHAAFDQHIYSNTYITFSDDGQKAVTLSKVYNPQGMLGPDGEIHFFGNHGEYRDEWEKTDLGWRIRNRLWDQKFHTGDYPFDRAMPRAAQYEVVDRALAEQQ
jgi:hypothetical protein